MSRDDFLFVTCLSVPPKAAAPTASLPTGAAAAPVCVLMFCTRPAVRDDLCESCWEKTQDIRAEWESLRAEYEGDGW